MRTGKALSAAHETERYLWSVTPCLMAWPAVTLQPGPGALVIGATLGIVYAVDASIAAKGLLPSWCGVAPFSCASRVHPVAAQHYPCKGGAFPGQLRLVPCVTCTAVLLLRSSTHFRTVLNTAGTWRSGSR